MAALTDWERDTIIELFVRPLDQRLTLDNYTDRNLIRIRNALNRYENERNIEVVDTPVYDLLMEYQFGNMTSEEMNEVINNIIDNATNEYINRKRQREMDQVLEMERQRRAALLRKPEGIAAPAAGGAYKRKTRRMKRRNQRKSLNNRHRK